jgi:hypothetical protein
VNLNPQGLGGFVCDCCLESTPNRELRRKTEIPEPTTGLGSGRQATVGENTATSWPQGRPRRLKVCPVLGDHPAHAIARVDASLGTARTVPRAPEIRSPQPNGKR